jgi:transposase
MSGTIYLGLDAHKDSVTIAVLPAGHETPTAVTKLPHDYARLEKHFRRLAQDGTTLKACYETSGVGFALQRAITRWGHHCDIVATSLIPSPRGRRRKHDKHDATALARFYAKGELTPVRVPTTAEEDDRELVRCRTTVQRELVRVRHFMLKFLTRQGYRFTDGTHWTRKHWRWLKAMRDEMSSGAQRTFDEYTALHEYVESRRDALDGEVTALAATPRYAPWVARLRCYRGIDTHGAMVLLTELGTDWRRFATAPGAMAYVGLVPSEHSSGESERRGSITKAGNSRARHVLVQGAWSARLRPETSAALRVRRADQPAAVVAHAQRAQERLYVLYRRLLQRRGPQIAVVAVARELMGFLWAAMQEQVVTTPVV